MSSVNTKAIDHALDRFSSFVRVQKANDPNKRLDAFDSFAECVGIGPLEWEHLTDKLGDIVESPGTELGWAIIGVLIGLYVKEYEELR